MIIFQSALLLQAHLRQQQAYPLHTGFVPTMGALHAGHISLISQSKSQQQLTVASIFVNPTQFNDPADFEKYPVTLEQDIRLLEQAGCDILLLPPVAEIYPNGTAAERHYELGTLETLLEGKHRPGHFQGVCQVVHRLLDIVKPGHLYLGQKDFQQCMVVRKLIELLQLPVQLHIGNTLRDSKGLALSSRNMRLSEEEKEKALAIYRQMNYIKENLDKQPPRLLEQQTSEALLQSGFGQVDYISVADPHTLQPLDKYEPGSPAVILAAAYMGAVRLIDNLVV